MIKSPALGLSPYQDGRIFSPRARLKFLLPLRRRGPRFRGSCSSQLADTRLGVLGRRAEPQLSGALSMGGFRPVMRAFAVNCIGSGMNARRRE